MTDEYRVIDEEDVVKDLIAYTMPIKRRQMSKKEQRDYIKSKLKGWRRKGLAYSRVNGQYRYDHYEVINFLIPAWRMYNDNLFIEASKQGRQLFQEMRKIGQEFGSQEVEENYKNMLKFNVRLNFSFNLKYFSENRNSFKFIVPFPIERSFQRVDIKSISPSQISPEFINENDSRWLSLKFDKFKYRNFIEFNLGFDVQLFEVNYEINPEKVGYYDKNDPNFKLYTVNSKKGVYFTEADQELKTLSKKIVESESNPFNKARKIYDWIMRHIRNFGMVHKDKNQDLLKYILRTGHGDCGMLSDLFVKLCRNQGLPARRVSGYLMYPQAPSGHIWAEFYLANYGWIPVDISIGWGYSCGGNMDSFYYNYYFGHLPHSLILNYSPNIIPQNKEISRIKYNLPSLIQLHGYENEHTNSRYTLFIHPKEYSKNKEFVFRIIMEVQYDK